MHVQRHRPPDAGALGLPARVRHRPLSDFRLAWRVRRARGSTCSTRCNPPDLIFLVALALVRSAARATCSTITTSARSSSSQVRHAAGLGLDAAPRAADLRSAIVSIATNDSFAAIARARAAWRPGRRSSSAPAPGLDTFASARPAGAEAGRRASRRLRGGDRPAGGARPARRRRRPPVRGLGRTTSLRDRRLRPGPAGDRGRRARRGLDATFHLHRAAVPARTCSPG